METREMKAMVVTRHPGLVEYMLEIGLVEAGVEVVKHASPEMVRGRHVIGVLPLELAAEAVMVTVVPLAVPPEMRGRELGLDEVRRYAGEPKTYRVEPVTRWYGHHEDHASSLVAGWGRDEVEAEFAAVNRPGHQAVVWEEGEFGSVPNMEAARVDMALEGLCEAADEGDEILDQSAARLAAAMGRSRPEYQPYLRAF